MSKTCRTCLLEIRETTYIKLNDNDVQHRSVRAELLACIPELQLDLVKDPVICCNCVNTLQLSYDFKTRCLFTEKRIRSCLRSAELNGKLVTLTKLFRFSRETNKGTNCSTINNSVVEDSDNVDSDRTAGERSPAHPGGASLDIEADNDEHEKIDDYITSTENKDSNVVTRSEGSLVDEGKESDLQNILTNNGTTMGSTLQPLEFRDKILEWSSAATCTDILGEMSQDLVNTMDDDIVKEEHGLLPFKTETDEAFSFKEESSNNDEEKRRNDCKIGTWDHVKEETRSITDDAEGNYLVDGEYEFPTATRDGENFEGSNSTNLDNQIKKSSVSVRWLSTNSNYARELYSDSTASSDATEPSVKKRRVKYEEETTNNYSTSSLIENSQEMSDADEDSLTKKVHVTETFKSREPLKTLKSCTINIDAPIKECFVNLQKLHLGDLMNKSSFNANELLNITSVKSLQTTNKKPEIAICNGKRNFSKQHQANSKKKSFCCNVCDYRAAQKGTLSKHMRTHSGEKPFQCKVCDFRTVHKGSLITHMRTHTGEKPFRCNVCDFSTAYQTHLGRHLLIHTGEKPFKCDICEFSATLKQSLIVHMRIHTGEKPFQCKVCDYSATLKQSVIIHMRIHTGEKPHQCQVCDYRTVHKQSLIRHMCTHTGKKPHQCQVCDYRAVHKQSLIRHMRTHIGK